MWQWRAKPNCFLLWYWRAKKLRTSFINVLKQTLRVIENYIDLIDDIDIIKARETFIIIIMNTPGRCPGGTREGAWMNHASGACFIKCMLFGRSVKMTVFLKQNFL